jgi:hypothetical protein
MDESLFGPPETLRIPLDGHRFDCVGHLADGRQFVACVTGAFPDGYILDLESDEWQKVKRWIAVVHLFDAGGNHLSSESRFGAFDIEGWDTASDKAWSRLNEMLGPLRALNPKLGDVFVKPFSTQIEGVTHSLLYQATKYEEDGPTCESVMLEPRDIMFHPPWDSGEYST